jgi:ABC-type Fe3+ transport system substrate-binding protein
MANIRSPRSLYTGAQNSQPLGPLPTGWEQLWDPEVRQPFFIDHNTQTTTVRRFYALSDNLKETGNDKRLVSFQSSFDTLPRRNVPMPN